MDELLERPIEEIKVDIFFRPDNFKKKPWYAVHILDSIIDKLVRQVFTRLKAIPKEEIVNIQY